jgi:hypothetical protein
MVRRRGTNHAAKVLNEVNPLTVAALQSILGVKLAKSGVLATHVVT